MSWKDEAEKVSLNWREESEPVVSTAESVARGVGQGVFGVGDELEGAAKAIADVAGPEKSITDLLSQYRLRRDEARQLNKLAQAANPKAFTSGELGTGLAMSFVPGLNVAKGASLAARLGAAGAQGAAYGLGSSEADITKGEIGDAAVDALISGGTGAALSGAGEVVSRGLSKAGGLASKRAEKLAESATGATRVQAEKFKPGTGRELLERGVVRFGDSPEQISKRAAGMLESSGDEIGKILSSLDERGAQVQPQEILSKIDDAINALKSEGAGKSDQVRMLGKIKEDIIESIGESPINLTGVEKQKRSFGNVNWMDLDKAMAKKSAYRALRDLTEEKATQLDPSAAKKFAENKALYGLLDPVQEAAEKRALQLNQSPWGGLLDTAAGLGGVGYGLQKDGDIGDALSYGAGAAAFRRLIAPRLKSSAAVGFDKISQALQSSTGAAQQLGARAPFLQQGAQNYISPKQAADEYQNRK